MKIAVAGTGYVGLSLAVLLAQHNEAEAVDVAPEKVDMLNAWASPIKDEEIEHFLGEAASGTRQLSLAAMLDGKRAYSDAELVVIATPTNYDSERNFFDARYVEQVIELVLEVNPQVVMVVKSTVPVGYTKTLVERYPRAGSCSAPSSSARGMRCTTTCTLRASSAACRAGILSTSFWRGGRTGSWACWSRGRIRPIMTA